jgi:hypothetical protein
MHSTQLTCPTSTFEFGRQLRDRLSLNDKQHTDVWLLAQGAGSMLQKTGERPCAAKSLLNAVTPTTDFSH